jgi:hypothetical protein
MDRDITDALETLANLLYLARASLDYKKIADEFLATAEGCRSECRSARSRQATESSP